MICSASWRIANSPGVAEVYGPRKLIRVYIMPLVLVPVVEKQCFGAASAFVVATANPDPVHPPPVLLALRMHLRIAVNLRCRGLEDLGLAAFGQAEHVDGAMHAGLRRLDRISW